MKQIIVPTDFSEGAWNALLYATGLAEALGIREILVINSFTAPHAGAATLVSIDRIMQQDSEEGLNKLMHKIKESGLSTRYNFHSKSIHSELVEAISSQVEDYNKTLVVMGSLGETGTVEKIFGSNASNVARNVHCPVLIIPPHVSYAICKDVVLASDYDKVSERNLQILRAIYALDPTTKLQIVHVQKDEDEAEDLASMGISQEDIPHVIKEIKGKNVGQALDDYVSSLKADLLVIIKKETGFIEGLFHRSVTKKLALLGHIPLLVLK